MAYKTKNSPLKQFGSLIGAISMAAGQKSQRQSQQQGIFSGTMSSTISRLASQVQAPPPTTSTNNGYLWGMGGAAGAVNTAMKGMPTNPNSLKEKVTATKAARKTQQMNPKATGNNATVKSVFGQEQVPGSYNRSMSALPQTQEINPILPPTTSLQPVQPPADVQQAITPTYDLSNQ